MTIGEPQSLRSLVLKSATEDDGLTSASIKWIAAALGSEATWQAACLDTEAPAAPALDSLPGTGDQHTSGGRQYFLRAIEVQGFRGVGPSALLSLTPRPGLVIVSGRNGSGKSSFAEALEVALTGESVRLAKRSGIWLSQWRNLHHGDPVRVETEFVAITSEGGSPQELSIGVTWDHGDDLAAAECTVELDGADLAGGRADLGFERALELYRPLLTYEELGTLLDGRPSELHDALHRLLGLEELDQADKRLAAFSKELKEPINRAKQALKVAKSAAEGLRESDARAAQALELMGRNPDREALADLARGTNRPEHDKVRQLDDCLDWFARRLDSCTSERASSIAYELREAQREGHLLSAAADIAADQWLELLERALALHAPHVDSQLCPICGVGALDEAWRENAQRRLQEAQESRRQLKDAKQRLNQAVMDAQSLMSTPAPPQALTLLANEQVPWASPAVSSLSQWNRSGDDLSPEAIAEHLDQQLPTFRASLTTAAQAAQQDRKEREDAWQPVVEAIQAWLKELRIVDEGQARQVAVEKASTWLRDQRDGLRNQRIEPLSEQAALIWGQLRQESSVSLGRVTLAGTATSRRVDLTANVDDAPTEALAVMSQGELHALALALFLPRATQPESPFRFLVLDDPIQAMDPAKVDGFVRVLSSFAIDHQVIVFSHDDRLPAALRRSGKDGTVYEVVRGHESTVSVRLISSPARRYLDDAKAVIRDRELPDSTLRMTLPVLLRSALEASARDRYFDTAMSGSMSLDDCERIWQADPRTSVRLRISLGLDQSGFDAWLRQESYRNKALGVTTTAAHSGLQGDPRAALGAVERVVEYLEALPHPVMS